MAIGKMTDVHSRIESFDEFLRRLYDTKISADITIIVRPGSKQVTVKAHKFVLRQASDDFFHILNELEKKAGANVIIIDAEPEDVEIMLRHLYRKNFFFLSVEQSLNVLRLAIRYHLTSLEELCSRHIERRIRASNACEIYETTLSLGQLDLVYKSFECIKKETDGVCKETDFTDTKSSTLEIILREDRLNVHSEFELLETLIKWGKAQLKVRCEDQGSVPLRKIVHPLLKHVRFLFIKKEEFEEIQRKTKIFSAEEVGKIIMKYLDPNWSDLPEWFNQLTRPRAYNDVKITRRSILQYRWCNMSQMPRYCSQLERKITSKFIAKEDFFLRGFVITSCKECSHRNIVARKNDIHVKLTITKGNLTREVSLPLHFLSGRFSIDHDTNKDIYKCVPLILKKEFPPQEPLHFNGSLGMNAPPTLNSYMDGDISKVSVVTEFPCSLPSTTVELAHPMYVEKGKTFSLTMESESPFYNCRSVPSFDTSPFSAFNETTTDTARSFVWCSYHLIHYSLVGSKQEILGHFYKRKTAVI